MHAPTSILLQLNTTVENPRPYWLYALKWDQELALYNHLPN